MTNRGLRCGDILLPKGWARDMTLEFGSNGRIASIRSATTDDVYPSAKGPVIPGLPNLHSHAFQRAMAGMTESAGAQDDDFWSWRQAVYRFVSRLTPDDTEVIAAQLYVEMLKAGYTAVGEFHYLHHAPDGAPYDDPAEMSHRIAAAADRSGIGLTLLPVLYAQGGFDGAPTEEGQRRYVCDLDTYSRIVETVYAQSDANSAGVAPHSLRAVGPDALQIAIELAGEHPVHIHIAEQTREVEECLAWSGARPVEWLLQNAEVDGRWCFVHATHMTAVETRALAESGAVAGLCPMTEADLGDGIFPAEAFITAKGRIGIGSDSNVVVDGAEELRLLEFGQRLIHRKRNLLRLPGRASTGANLFELAVHGGAGAIGREASGITVGSSADFIVLDGAAPLLAEKSGDDVLDTFIFSGGRSLIRDVFVGGRAVVTEGRHEAEAEISKDFSRVMKRLMSE